jgi:hypothetical protein
MLVASCFSRLAARRLKADPWFMADRHRRHAIAVLIRDSSDTRYPWYFFCRARTALKIVERVAFLNAWGWARLARSNSLGLDFPSTRLWFGILSPKIRILFSPVRYAIAGVAWIVSTQRYSVAPHPIETLLTYVKSGEIAIPEIQRPFVWEATKVRNLLDSLYQGYPIGYLITWRNPTIKLKDGTSAAGKRILIDGQQRVTALMAALLGREVLTKDYETVRIRIAFHPQDERFEVANPAIRKF